MENTKNQKTDVGACWVRTTKTNEKMLSIKLNLNSFGVNKEVELVGWLNRDKAAGDKRPDFRLHPSQPRAQGQAPVAKTTTPAPQQAAPVQEQDNSIL